MRSAIAVLAAAVAVRLVIAAIVPLVPDEAYYWEWSRHLAAGYFDHPPAIAWLVRVGTVIAGPTPLGVRLGPIVAGFAGGCAAISLAHRLGGARGAWRMAVLLAVVPLAGVGLVLATPDAPLLASAALLLWAVDHALTETASAGTAGRSTSEARAAPTASATIPYASPTTAGQRGGAGLGWWLAAGAALGLGMCSKYTVVLIPAAVVVACLVSPVLRVEFRRPGPYLASGVAAIVFLPVARWNAEHDWVSFRFQLHHGLGAVSGSAVGRELTLIGGQAGLVSPVLFVLAVAAVGRALTDRHRPRHFVLAVVAVFGWVFFAASAVRRPVEPNWPALAVLPALVLLATWIPSPKWERWEQFGVAIGGAMVVGAYVVALVPIPWLPLRADPVARAYGWNELARAVVADRTRDTVTSAPVAFGGHTWLAADRYQDAAELAFNMPRQPLVFSLNLAGRPNQYDLWPTARDSLRPGDTLTAVFDDVPDPPAPVARLRPHFSRVERGAVVELHRGSHVVARRRLWHFFGLTVPL